MSGQDPFTGPIDDLYREVVLEHARHPRNRRAIASPTHQNRGANPICGDELTIGLRVADERIADIAFTGRGCAISQASASMMADLLKGRELSQVDDIAAAVRTMLSGDGTVDEEALGDAVALRAVRQFPRRVACATLAWTTLAEALGTSKTAKR
ncbi:MAG: SUF system NifU family Fe-S cluster assembly protein [Chloroflexota bacterium]|nr:MAG: SUF system NifU family Fe-S cluster assembly protein [Chloroflexota bacterium]